MSAMSSRREPVPLYHTYKFLTRPPGTLYRGLKTTQDRLDAWNLIFGEEQAAQPSTSGLDFPKAATPPKSLQVPDMGTSRRKTPPMTPTVREASADTPLQMDIKIIDLTSSPPAKRAKIEASPLSGLSRIKAETVHVSPMPPTATRVVKRESKPLQLEQNSNEQRTRDLTSETAQSPAPRASRPSTDAEIKAQCALVLFDIESFRETITFDTWTHLRQMRPSLQPWHWDETIWSTNQPINGTLFGQCMFAQSYPQKAYKATNLVTTDVYYLHWDCSSCELRHQIKMTRRTVMMLGAGLLDRDTWEAYLREEIGTTALCTNQGCQDLVHLISEQPHERNSRYCRNYFAAADTCTCDIGQSSGKPCLPHLRFEPDERLGHYIKTMDELKDKQFACPYEDCSYVARGSWPDNFNAGRVANEISQHLDDDHA